MTAEVASWRDEHGLDHRRRLRTGICISIAVHGIILGLFTLSPPMHVAPQPEYLAVDLVAAAPGGGAPARAPAPAPPTPPAAAPEPPPPEPAPAPKAPVQVLPEESPNKVRQKPEPTKTVAKAKPKPKTTPRRRKPREKELSYEDAMAELGLDETSEALVPAASRDEKNAQQQEGESSGGASQGIKVSPEQLAWDRSVISMIQERFPNLARYEGRGLVTRIEIELSASGGLQREPRLVGTSGDLEFDRMIIAIIERAAPLPPPPRPGVRSLSLKSDR